MDKETKKPYFTIVMPAYGVEKYIGRAILSIQKQTFDNWEIIVVDDCSVDRSSEIACKYAAGDSRIQVLHHETNQGLSAARNTGTDAASGRYVWYMDSDDYADDTLLAQVYASIERNPAQVILFGHVEEYYDKKGHLQYTHTICPKEHYFQTSKELRPYIIELEQETLYGYAWNKFYRLSHIQELKLKYENVRLIEDIVFNIKYFMDIESLNVLPVTPYHYGKRLEANLTNKFVPDYFVLHRQRIEMLFDQFSYWGICTQEVRSILGSLYARYILSALERNCNKQADMSHAQRYQWCRSVFAQGLFNELIPGAKAKDSTSLRVALVLFRWKRAILCLMMGRGIYIIKKCMPMVYSKIKSER
ncbi:MAG: glycosyltransferase family 2 protein [Muricomes sp.]